MQGALRRAENVSWTPPPTCGKRVAGGKRVRPPPPPCSTPPLRRAENVSRAENVFDPPLRRVRPPCPPQNVYIRHALRVEPKKMPAPSRAPPRERGTPPPATKKRQGTRGPPAAAPTGASAFNDFNPPPPPAESSVPQSVSQTLPYTGPVAGGTYVEAPPALDEVAGDSQSGVDMISGQSMDIDWSSVTANEVVPAGGVGGVDAAGGVGGEQGPQGNDVQTPGAEAAGGVGGEQPSQANDVQTAGAEAAGGVGGEQPSQANDVQTTGAEATQTRDVDDVDGPQAVALESTQGGDIAGRVLSRVAKLIATAGHADAHQVDKVVKAPVSGFTKKKATRQDITSQVSPKKPIGGESTGGHSSTGGKRIGGFSSTGGKRTGGYSSNGGKGVGPSGKPASEEEEDSDEDSDEEEEEAQKNEEAQDSDEEDDDEEDDEEYEDEDEEEDEGEENDQQVEARNSDASDASDSSDNQPLERKRRRLLTNSQKGRKAIESSDEDESQDNTAEGGGPSISNAAKRGGPSGSRPFRELHVGAKGGPSAKTAATAKAKATREKNKANGGPSKGGRKRKILKSGVDGICKQDIKRLARRAGITRIDRGLYKVVREQIESFTDGLLFKTAALTTSRGARTITHDDVIKSLQMTGGHLAFVNSGGALNPQ